MASNLSQLAKLAAEIASNAAILNEYFNKNNLPQPAFGVDAPVEFQIHDATARNARIALATAGKKLQELMLPPIESVRLGIMNEMYLHGSLQALCHFNVPQTVPLDGDISLTELGSRTKLNEDILSRMINMAIANLYFVESRPGFIAHTIRSKLLAIDEGSRAFLTLKVKTFMPSVAKWTDVLEKFPDLEEPSQSAFSLSFGQAFFDYLESNPDMSDLFAKSMSGSRGRDAWNVVASAYDWSQFGNGIVDVGGGIGHISLAIAKQHPKVKLLVEDLEGLTEKAVAHISSEGLSSTVKFLSHNMFEPQPEAGRGASAYFLGDVLHDWPDLYCQRLLKNLVEAMPPDGKIILSEWVMPSGKMPEQQEIMLRAMDLNMFSLLNGRQRTREQWDKLLKSVDQRLHITKVIGPPVMVKTGKPLALALEFSTVR